MHGGGGIPGMFHIDGVTVYGQTHCLAEREAIFAFVVRGWKTTDLVEHFARSGISLLNRVSDAYSGHTLAALGIEECARVSACHYNTIDEIRRFLKVLAGIIRENRSREKARA